MISNKENTRVEYKVVLTKEVDIEKEIIAFLNYNEGGYVYIGIDRYGNTVGVNDVDGDMLKIKDRIKHNISPSAMGLFTVESLARDGKDIIKITIASGSEKPYFKTKCGMSPKGTYIRIGTSAEPMEQNMIDNLFARRVKNSIGRIKSNRQDLTFSQLRIYYDEKGKPLNENFKKSLEFLTDEGKYNYVAYLMADENNNSVKVAKFSSLNKLELGENKEFGRCSLIKIVNQVLDKLEVENRISTKITYPYRIDTPYWNSVALREAVINSFVHNDYTYELSPTFEIYPDRIEIRSFGRLPESMSEEEFFTGTSMPKNKELMRIFSDVELVESLGLGIPRIVEIYGRECFSFSENFIQMTFPVAGYKSNQDGTEISNQDGVEISNQDGSDNCTGSSCVRDYLFDKQQVSGGSCGLISAKIGNQDGTGTSNQDGAGFGNQDGAEISNQDDDIINIIYQYLCSEQIDLNMKIDDVRKYLLELEKESVKILRLCKTIPQSKETIFNELGLTQQKKNSDKYLQPLIDRRMVILTIKDKPTSKYQKYAITGFGRDVLRYFEERE